MGHFAKIENGIVTEVIVADQDFINTGLVGDPTLWVKTSYNTKGGVHYEQDGITPSADQAKALRANYAGVGYFYDVDNDVFIPPKPFESWVLNKVTCLWQAPIEMPDDGKLYRWDDSAIQWVEIVES